MAPYSRPQLWVLLAVVALGGLGVAIGGWRRAHPDLADRIERFDDRTPPADPRLPVPSPRAGRGRATVPPGDARAPAREAKRQAREGPLDLNRATAQDLRRLPGVGPALAARILTARARSGRFESVDDLRAVAGIGEGKLGRLRDRVTVAR